MYLHIDSKKFSKKPTSDDIKGIKFRLKESASLRNVTTKQLASILTAGHTIQPGCTPFTDVSRAQGKTGTCKDDWKAQQVFMVDIDNELVGIPLETPEHAAVTLADYDLPPAFAYPSFSSTAERPRFRIVLVCDEVITDRAERMAIQMALISLFPQADTGCKNEDRIFFGTNQGLCEGVGDMNAVCSKADLTALAAITDDLASTPSCSENLSHAVSSTHSSSDGESIIPVGNREMEMFRECTKIVSRYGDSAEARAMYDAFIARLEFVPNEPDPPQKKAEYVWNRCIKYQHNVREKRSDYKPPEKFNGTNKDATSYDFNDITDIDMSKIVKFDILATVYCMEHQYFIGVQPLTKGGFGNDTVYEYHDGIWAPQSESDVKSTLAKRVVQEGKIPVPANIDKAYKVIVTSGKRICTDEFNKDEDLICFQNAVYRLSDGAVLQHSPDYLFTRKLNASIPDELLPTPYCDLCLGNFGDEAVQYLLLQIFGAAISNVHIYHFKKGVLQYGVGNSGKTQLKHFAERVVGYGNYNNVDLAELEGNRFLPAAFQNVQIGGSNDMSNVTVKEQKIFKQLTGGDSIQAEHKGEDSFTFQYKGLLWFLSNHLPLFGGDKGAHLYDRWIVIHCENAVPPEKQIKDLGEKMYAERDSFCLKALQAFSKAVSNNYTFDVPESCVLANIEYQHKNSLVQSFIDECCEPLNRDNIPNDATTCGQLWTIFKDWTYKNKCYTPKKSDFIQELADSIGIPEKDLRIHTKSGDYYPYIVTDSAKVEYDFYWL